MISFGLTRSAKVVFDIFGPGPSCALAGKLPLAGKKGLNRYRFDGTVTKVVSETAGGVTVESVQNVTLEPGTYKLELNSRGGKRRLAQTFVTVVDPSSPRKAYPSPDCSAARRRWSSARSPLSSRPTPARSPPRPPTGLSPPCRAFRPVATPTARPRRSRRRPEGRGQQQGLGVPVESGAAGDESWTLLDALLLAFVLGLMVALVVAVYRSLRRRPPLA